jgi:hypothetical protein
MPWQEGDVYAVSGLVKLSSEQRERLGRVSKAMQEEDSR